MILAHQRLRPKAASCVNQNPAKCVLAHKIESASDRRNCFFRWNTQAVGSSSRQSKKHRRMLKKTNRTLFAALITLSLIGQGATAIASGCSAGHAASADTVTGATPDAVHATHDHTAVINRRGKSVSPASAGSLADCCTNLLCFLDNCATSASLSIVATLLPEPFDDSSILSPAYVSSDLSSASAALFRPPIRL